MYYYHFESFPRRLTFKKLCRGALLIPFHHNSRTPAELERHAIELGNVLVSQLFPYHGFFPEMLVNIVRSLPKFHSYSLTLLARPGSTLRLVNARKSFKAANGYLNMISVCNFPPHRLFLLDAIAYLQTLEGSRSPCRYPSIHPDLRVPLIEHRFPPSSRLLASLRQLMGIVNGTQDPCHRPYFLHLWCPR